MKYNIPRDHLFRYFQVRQFAKSLNPSFPNRPEDSYDKILDSPPNLKGCISRIYKIINSAAETNIVKIKGDWEKELGVSLSESFWNQALIRVNKSSSVSRLSIIQFKVLHRVHYCNSKLSKIYPNVQDSCNRCHKFTCRSYAHVLVLRKTGRLLECHI